MNNAALLIYESLSVENKKLLQDIRNLSLKKVIAGQVMNILQSVMESLQEQSNAALKN